MPPERDNDMFQHLNVERLSDRSQAFGCLDIEPAGRWVAARMVMDENDRGGVEFDRPPKYRAGIDCEMAERSALQLFIRNEAVRGVKEQHAQRLIGKRPHRCPQITQQFGIVGVDAATAQLFAHGLECRAVRGDEHRADRAVFAERSCQRLGRLREEAPQGPMFREQSLG